MEGYHGLVRIEAERIIAILEDTTDKLGFLDSITPDLLQHRDELSKFIGDEISRTMAEQRALERRYEELIEQRAAMKGMVNKTKYKEVQEEIQEVSRALRESTNNLVRSLKDNPNVSGNLIKVQRDRMELHDLLLRCIQELRDRGSYNTIIFKVDEENNARLRLQQLKTREKTLRDAVAQLQEELQEEQRAFQHQTMEQRHTISQLKDQLQTIKGSTSTDARFRRKESLAIVSAIWREFKLRERGLETRLKELEDKLQTEVVVNNNTKQFLVRKNAQLAGEIEKWETKYDEDVGKKMDREISALTKKRTQLSEKLHILRSRKQVEMLEEKAREEAAERELEAVKQRKALLKKQNAAARTIVREIRNYIKRKRELEALKAKSKEKKGKGKKGEKPGKK